MTIKPCILKLLESIIKCHYTTYINKIMFQDTSLSPSLSLSLSLHFNSHFPGGPGLADSGMFTGQMPFLSTNQHCQNTEGNLETLDCTDGSACVVPVVTLV